MAINKKLIHFKNKSTFNSKKLSANEANTQYQVGGTGTVTTGAPDINYQSIVYIKDSKEVWTHGTFYSGTTGSSAWADITGKPSWIGDSKPSYSWSEISSKPSWIGSSKPSYAWSEITSKPSFATVATSGSYNDLSNKPTIPSQYTLPAASNSALGGIKLTSSTKAGTPQGISTTSGRTYAVQLTSNNEAVVNVPWTDTTSSYTLPTASSSTLGGIKVGNGLNINSGVLSVMAPQVDNHTVYNLVGYKSGINPLKNTPQLTFKSSEISGSKSGTLTIGDDPESGPSWLGALNLEYSERSNLASVYTESPLSITSSLGDLGIYASDAGGGGKLTLSTASSIHLINSSDNFATVQLKPRSDSNGYSYLNFICGPSDNAGSTVLELGGANDQAIFSGSVSANGGFFDTSDARVKTNVRELNAINADAIKLVEFDRTDTEHHGYGVIAQEVEEVYPSVVNTDANGFKSVNYNEIAMIKIKYLEDKVARLEALVARLESKLS